MRNHKTGWGIKARRGVAMMMVLAVVGVAAVMSYGVLAAATLQVQTRANAALSAQADYLAESGVNIAMYYLQYPDQANLSGGQTYWRGANNISLGSSVPGTVDVSVTQPDTSKPVYSITTVGKARVGSGPLIQHSSVATVEIDRTAYIPHAVTINTDFTVRDNMRIEGSIHAAATVTLNVGAVVTGAIFAPGLIGGKPGQILNPPSASITVPTKANVNHYSSYQINGVTYWAQSVGDLDGVTLGPTFWNPAGVYYHDGAMKITDNVRINGTLVVRNGRLQVRGTGNSITANDGFPALIVDNNLQFYRSGKSLSVNGLAWIGQKVTGSGSTSDCTLTINGALMMGGKDPDVDSAFDGMVTVRYNSERLKVLNFSPDQPQKGVRVLSWKP